MNILVHKYILLENKQENIIHILYHFRPSHSAIGMGDTRSPRLARSRRPDDESNSYPDVERNEVC